MKKRSRGEQYVSDCVLKSVKLPQPYSGNAKYKSLKTNVLFYFERSGDSLEFVKKKVSAIDMIMCSKKRAINCGVHAILHFICHTMAFVYVRTF